MNCTDQSTRRSGLRSGVGAGARPGGRHALVVGLGTAGLTAAMRLHQTGWEVTALERAPARRGGGYMIGLFGSGAAAAKRMGVLDAIGTRRDADSAGYEVDRAGRRRAGLSLPEAERGGPRLILRGDVERALFAALPTEVEVRFSTSPTAIHHDGDGILVGTRDSATGADRTERFDLVVGTDGVRSTVRRLAFGPHEDYLHSLSHIVAASLLKEQVKGFRRNDGLTLAEPGRAAWVFPFADHTPSLMMSYRTDDVAAEFQRPPAESLRRAFGPEPLGPVLESLIEQYENADTTLFDTAEQVRMPSWHTGRVVLLGDAAWCLTLYSGMGTSSALAGADALATVLQRRSDDISAGLADWEAQMRPFIDYHQGATPNGLNFFVPQDRRRQLARSAALRLMHVPLLGAVMRKANTRSLDFVMKSRDVAA